MVRSFRIASLIAVMSLVVAAPVQAGKVKVWNHYNQGHYEKAQLKGAVVSSEGTLRLSRQLRPLANVEATHVWDAIEDRAGNLFVATGDEGKIYKVAADGRVGVVYTSPDSQVLSLALAADGTVFAGTGPSGTIIALPPKGNARIFAEDLDHYVWSLVYDPESRSLYAGTGPKGRIYRISPEGKSSVFYTTRQEHVLCLAQGGKVLYAGTDKGGLVYRIDSAGKGFVLYQSHQAEVRSLLVTGDGVYAGTSSPVRKRPTGSAGASPTPAAVADGSTPAATPPIQKPVAARPVSSGSATSATEETRNAAAPSAPPPASGENSLYRIAADGTVRELFRDKTMILSLLRQSGRLLVGTGMQGQLFEINELTKEKSEIARLDHGQIHCLLGRRDGSIVLGTGDPGKLYILENKFAAKGQITSDVLDAKIISRWGALSWKATTPPGTTVTVSVRTGNVAEPDATWSEWSAEYADPEKTTITSPTARFLQYRVTLTSTSPQATPELHRLALRYRTTNQAPEISSFEVPDLDALTLENPKKLKLKWSATDANEDELSFSLFVRKDGWKDWVALEQDLEKKDYEWDTTTFPSGQYQIKLVTSDRRDNSAEEALSAEKVSPPVAVAHTPPTVNIKVGGMEGDQVILEATASDPIVRLSEAAFALNGKRWTNVFPSDGLFDSKSETFRFKTEGLRPGTYVVVLRVRDAAGNTGAGDVVFTVREKK